ncbi:prepilin-type N-terminal cleavage/methylation domain-containing protein [Bacillus sp. MCCB 382]|nr:prepilin-type N-terminal cleavage/methylation domain-containing protein [Bacillus sp. MCCB 382]
MMIENERGYTLVELLAVIVILGIIAIIAVLAVNNIIEKSK